MYIIANKTEEKSPPSLIFMHRCIFEKIDPGTKELITCMWPKLLETWQGDISMEKT